MIYLYSFSVIILNLFAIILKKNSKLIILITILASCIFFAGNYNNPDYFTYSEQYSLVSTSPKNIIFYRNKQYGFYLLMKIFVQLGLEYNQFLFFIALACMLLINSTVQKYVKNPHIYYILFFIFPFLLCIVQIRNFIIMAILVYALRYLIDSSKSNNIKYIICILVASSFHTVALVYLILLFNNKIDYEKRSKYFVVGIITLSIIIVVTKNTSLNFITNAISSILGTDDGSRTLSNRTTYEFLGPLFFQSITTLLFIWAKKINDSNLDLKDKNIFTKIYWCNIISFSFLPCFMISTIFARIIINMLPIYYISLINTVFLTKKNSLERILFVLCTFVLVFLFFYWFIYRNYSDSIFSSVFKYNAGINILL
ncbi:EpsG family protein [Eubacterium callanderi]|uniref:EpsG family protein n=1 Tax=Eubacterium callanderi TaxID=53442 RepID=A0A853JRS4_9FIRM|nr:EpsG family protein [Eubacterium callanderi]